METNFQFGAASDRAAKSVERLKEDVAETKKTVLEIQLLLLQILETRTAHSVFRSSSQAALPATSPPRISVQDTPPNAGPSSSPRQQASSTIASVGSMNSRESLHEELTTIFEAIEHETSKGLDLLKSKRSKEPLCHRQGTGYTTVNRPATFLYDAERFLPQSVLDRGEKNLSHASQRKGSAAGSVPRHSRVLFEFDHDVYPIIAVFEVELQCDTFSSTSLGETPEMQERRSSAGNFLC
ncbi:hypothetical protein EVG20_g3928 [Dentipellis fragilis]|uniref:Uncharacterized protein n=1 Tax=Dentipellis fragilis TaxID=205917 RepID=A0A4Y9YXY5_9AGAM|nr:hypothetical protein EVG20_g3928 [Dentipellis fragilis]